MLRRLKSTRAVNKINAHGTLTRARGRSGHRATRSTELSLIEKGSRALIDEGFAFACGRGDLISVEQGLRNQSVDPSGNDNAALKAACENGHSLIVDILLIDERVSPEADSNYCIRLASKNGHTAVVSRLLKDPRVNPAAQKNYAIRTAAAKGYNSIVEKLCKSPLVNPGAQRNFALVQAAANGYVKVVKTLLKNPEVDPCSRGGSALLQACSNGHAKVVQVLLKDERMTLDDELGSEALQAACEKGKRKVFDILLRQPSLTPSAQVLYWAVDNERVEIVKLLLKNELFDPSEDKNRALCIALEQQNSELVDMLCEDSRVASSLEKGQSKLRKNVEAFQKKQARGDAEQ